ncbi:MAG: 50S ribosomal protein L28 [Myxococcota bacterium]
MARVCDVTGKRKLKGNKVSHSNRKSRKFQEPNLQSKRFWLPSEKRWIKLRVSVDAIRTIDKRGIEAVVKDLRAAGRKI